MALHKVEKEPFLEGGRKVDAKWFGTRDAAVIATKWAKGLSDDYIKAEDARRKEAARIENERIQREHAEKVAAAQREAEEAAASLPIGCEPPPVEIPDAPPPVVVAEAVKVGTGARRQSMVSREVWEIVDQKSLFHFLAEMNLLPQMLLEEARKFGENLAAGGVEVPGMKSRIVESVR